MTELRTYLVAVQSIHYHVVQAPNLAYANMKAMESPEGGYERKVVRTKDVTEQWEEGRTWTQ